MQEIIYAFQSHPRTFLQYRKPQIFFKGKHQSQERTEVQIDAKAVPGAT